MGLLQAIEGYMRKHGVAQTRFGRMAVNDPRLVIDLRRGRRPGARTIARIERFLAEDAA